MQATLAFKANFFAEVVMRSLGFFIMIYLWKAVYAQSGDIAGFSFTELLTYFLLVELFRNFLSVSTFEEIKTGVLEGKIANYLLLPLNSLYMYFARNVAQNMVSMLFFVIPVAILIVGTNYFVGPANLIYLLLTLAMVLIALFSSMFLYTLFGSISFWTVETGNIIWAFNFIISFFAGKMIPVQFLPEIIRNIVQYTPFVAIFNLPASIYLGKFSYEELILQFAVQIAWMIGLYFLLVVVWKKGLRRLELVGG
jgi:ABC-2 type transport system permease protein